MTTKLDTEITGYERCLLIALVKTADFDKVAEWLKDFGWTGYSNCPEMVERAILELKDELLHVYDGEDDD